MYAQFKLRLEHTKLTRILQTNSAIGFQEFHIAAIEINVIFVPHLFFPFFWNIFFSQLFVHNDSLNIRILLFFFSKLGHKSNNSRSPANTLTTTQTDAIPFSQNDSRRLINYR